MEIVNAILIFLALVLMWWALNLDRAPAARVEIDQSSQLNDSMTFLQKLRTKSPNEIVQSKRVKAYQANLLRMADENPNLLDGAENLLDEREEETKKMILNMINDARQVREAKAEEQGAMAELIANQRADANLIETNLIQLIEMIALVHEESSSTSETIARVSEDVGKVKAIVGY
jgi:hypothetical protein